jgi:hypothetical protein
MRNKKRIDWDADERRFSGFYRAKKFSGVYLRPFKKKGFYNSLNVGAAPSGRPQDGKITNSIARYVF